MGLTRVVVLSDLHLAAGPLASCTHGAALADLIAAQPPRTTTLVLAGDVFDLLHVPGRPAHLDLPGAPELIAGAVQAIAGEPWGRDVLDAWAGFLRAGGACVLIPGNHDPELHHPAAATAILSVLGLPLEPPPSLTVHRDDDPWSATLGNVALCVAHGHRTDRWNDIDPASLRQALETGRRDLPLPLGSRLVVEVLNAFKSDVNGATGRPRFGFVDLLKPELPAVGLLLLYLDPPLTLSKLGAAFGLAPAAVARVLKGTLRGGATLASMPEASEAPEALPEWLAGALASAIAAELPEDWRGAPSRVLDAWEGLVAGAAPPARLGLLAGHQGLRRYVLRAALRALSDGGTFFDPAALAPDEREAVERWQREGTGPRVHVRGHSHAAREHRAGDVTYLNTGTWLDLLGLPEVQDAGDDDAVRAWIDAVEAGAPPRRTRLTYAEITPEGGRLREHPARAT